MLVPSWDVPGPRFTSGQGSQSVLGYDGTSICRLQWLAPFRRVGTCDVGWRSLVLREHGRFAESPSLLEQALPALEQLAEQLKDRRP